MDKKKISRLRIVLAVMISLVSVVFIFYRIGKIPGEKMEEILHTFASGPNLLLLLLVIVLMVLNWALEMMKWKLLLKPRIEISWKKSSESVLSGISLGAITPSRIGEFAGRIFYLPDHQKIFGTVASFTGGFAQNLVTIFSGLLCMIIYLMMYQNRLFIETPFLYYLVFILSIAVIILLVLVYLNLSYFIDKISHWRIFNRIGDYLPHTSDWSSANLGVVLLLSFLRYSVFSTQYLLLLYIFGIDLPFEEQMVKTGLVFMLTSLIPSYAISDIANRGSVSMFIFNDPKIDLMVAAASITLWIINLAIPGLAGNFFLIRASKKNQDG